MSVATISPCDLSPEELLLARTTFDTVVDDYLHAEHQLRQVLSKMGLFAPDDHIAAMMEFFENKISFSNFQQFLMFLKGVHKQPEAEDADTLRAFIALGGNSDRTGNVNADHLRFACKRFDLTIDIDKLIREVDTSRNGSIDYEEFQQLWMMGRGHGLSSIVTNDKQYLGRSFWMQAVRHAHDHTSEIEEELNLAHPNGDHNLDANALLNNSGRSDGDLLGGADGNNHQNQSSSSNNQRDIMSLPEAAGRVTLGVVLGNNSNDQNVEEMPKVDQLRNFLEFGNCAGYMQQQNGGGVEFGRRRASNHAHFAGSAMMMGSSGDLRGMMMGASTKNGGIGQSQRRGSMTNNNSNMLMSQNNNNMGSASFNPSASAMNNNNSNGGDMMMMNDNNGGRSMNYLPNSATHFMLRGNNANSNSNYNSSYNYQPTLPASDILPDPNATPAEVLAKAKQLMDERYGSNRNDKEKEKAAFKKESAELDEKVVQLGQQRPPVIGGITLPGKRSNDIELPDPFTIGSSGAGLHHPASGRRQMVSPTRSTADFQGSKGYATTSARYSSGSTVGSARGSARRGWK